MNKTVVAFPKNKETLTLLGEYDINHHDFEESFIDLITQTIREIRSARGYFNKTHMETLVQLLDHDWTPSAIPVLLPYP